MNVGLLCGSLGPRSANAAVLDAARSDLEHAGHSVTAIEGLASIPGFDPAKVDDPPAPVHGFRSDIRACDAVLIAAPEYAAGLGGSTKNALDWLVGDSTIYRKIVGVASAGTTGGVYAIEQLVRTISWQGGWVMATLGIAAPRAKSDEDGVITHADTLLEITDWVSAVVEAHAGAAADRSRLLASVVTRYGIDPARFESVD